MDFEKVYSIWICMNPSKSAGNTITRYSIRKEDLVGELEAEAGDYDILTMVMLCLGGDTGENYEGILKLLDVLFSKERNAGEKKQILEAEFGIEMTKKMEEEVHVMCNLSEGLVEEVTREVTERVTEQVTERVEQQFGKLNLRLLEEKRYKDLERAFIDKSYREQLCLELGI